MSLALFDLDNTLLAGDSDYSWGQFLIELGVVDRDEYEQANQRFYDDYQVGRLDIHEFAAFAFRPLGENALVDLERWREQFLRERIAPIMLPAGREKIEAHRQAGDDIVIITATNRFITEPIAAAFGVSQLLATEPEFRDGAFTGRIAGIPCFQQGKVERLMQWLAETGGTLDQSWFYSDSHNDIPLLERVAHPVAVDPDDALRVVAEERGWDVVSFRGAP
ncbi:MAG TPA: HAD family hydrolase [Gammaproteobacteria bacterium]|nr:HAD family hydrolase [Gammaproteobacteria bacterium]